MTVQDNNICRDGVHTVSTNPDDLLVRIRELEKQNQYLNLQIKEHRYGLTWIDVPEAFEPESESKIPVLEEVKDKSFDCRDGVCSVSGNPPHILIEGDNYHALTCLQYTHKGKIDVIYIDPPYNTGSDGFTYKDKRILTQYPDGTPVPKDHPLRHSYWLSFMHKRLELAKNLLSDDGVIFISIDDNEQANLKLLCDRVFGEKNFVCSMVRKTKSMTGDDGNGLNIQYEYLFVVGKIKQKISFKGESKSFEEYSNPDNDPNGLWCSADPSAKSGGSSTYFPIKNPYTGKEDFPPKGRYWAFSKKTLRDYINNGRIVFKKNYRENQRGFIFKRYASTMDNKNMPVGTLAFDSNEFMNSLATTELNEILGAGEFPYPKPSIFIKKIIQYCSSTNSVILDFFAGSGTTLHATLKLNEEDGGCRQCILVQQNEGEKRICEEVTYERNRRIMQGYTNAKGESVAGLGGSLKYYRTAFTGTGNPDRDPIMLPSDEDRITLAQNAGVLVSLAENTLYEIVKNKFYQIFTNHQGEFSAMYLQEDLSKFEDFKQEVENLKGKVTVYVFSWSNTPDTANAFMHLPDVEVKSYPNAILDAYRSAMQQVESRK